MKRRGFILGAVAAVVGAVVGRAKPAMSSSLNYGKADKVVTYARYIEKPSTAFKSLLLIVTPNEPTNAPKLP